MRLILIIGSSLLLGYIFLKDGLFNLGSIFPGAAVDANGIKQDIYFDPEKTFSSSVEQWRQIATLESNAAGLPVSIVLAIISVESSGINGQIGAAGERGLMQLKDVAAQDLGFGFASSDAATNIFQGTRFLRLQIERMGMSLAGGIRAYNQGETGAKSSPLNGLDYLMRVIAAAT